MNSTVTHLPWVGPAPPAPDAATAAGHIEVREQELVISHAQRLDKMRCECGHSWREVDLPGIPECPACHKLGVVTE